jgi:hypothetical protein
MDSINIASSPNSEPNPQEHTLLQVGMEKHFLDVLLSLFMFEKWINQLNYFTLL